MAKISETRIDRQSLSEMIEMINFLYHEGRVFGLSGGEMQLLDNLRDFARICYRTGRLLGPDFSRQLKTAVNIFETRGFALPHSLQEGIRKFLGSSTEELLLSLEKEITKRMQEAAKEKHKLNVVFLFGSGASHPPPSNIPTVNEMLDYLVDKLPPTELPFASKVKNWATKEGVNIEDILTAGYLGTLLVSRPIVSKLVGEIIYRELSEQPTELREREYVFSFQELIGRVFSMVSGMMANADSNPVHETIANLIKKHVNNQSVSFSIATTNYDICIEKALKKIDLSYRYLGVDEEEGIPIVKIHGSINWFYCEGCQSVITYSIKELEAFKKIFPTSGSCNKCGTASSLLMVPPIAYKYVMYPPLIEIWQAAMHTIENADIIIAIGYSFSLADDYVLKMVVSGIKKKKSIMILLNRDLHAIDSLSDRLSAYHLKLPYPIVGDALETVPKIAKTVEQAISKVSEGPVLAVTKDKRKSKSH